MMDVPGASPILITHRPSTRLRVFSKNQYFPPNIDVLPIVSFRRHEAAQPYALELPRFKEKLASKLS